MKMISGTLDLEGIKRCYVKGAIAEIECPNCGRTIQRDFHTNYLLYPVIGEDTEIYFYCAHCEEAGEKTFEFLIPAIVKSAIITIEYDPDNIRVA